MIRIIFVIFLLFLSISSYTQVNFKRDYLKNNPVDKSQFLSGEEEIKIHEDYLKEVKNRNDTLGQIYALFYLFADHYKTNDYVALKKILLEAEKLIDKHSKPEWQGALRMRRAYMLEIVDEDLEAAILQYEEAVELCKIAKDTLCLAESLEQLSNINKNLGNYEVSETYFKDAIVLMKAYATPSGIALAYSNYSLLASEQEKYRSALSYIDSAIAIASELKDTFNHVMYLSNKASIFYSKGDYREAIDLYEPLVPINTKNGWPDNLIYNYAGLINSYEELGVFEKSNIYLQQYYELRDSLNGAKVQEKIKKLELNDQLNRKELLLKQKENEIEKYKNLKIQLLGGLMILVLVVLMLLYNRYVSKKHDKKERLTNLNYINDLKNILQVKNSKILNLNERLTSFEYKPGQKNKEKDSSSAVQEFDFKIFDARIIDDEGITALKSYFDKIYPGLLFRVRKQWPTISDAEERLLMLVKLKIKSKEAAEILGISQSSVKKSRSRLRKRIGIDSSLDLEDYIDSIK